MLKKILAVVAMLYAAAAFAAVDVNKATAAELDGIKGIGPSTSTKILDERKTAPFEPKQFKDKYSDALRALVDGKIKHRKPVIIDEDTGSGGKVIDLVEALKRSVKNSGKPAAPASRRKKAG